MRFRRKKFPRRMLRIAHGKLPVFDEVVVLRDTLYLASFERERIISDQQRRVRLPLDPDMSMNVEERTFAGGQIVMRFIAFQMLIVVVELHVAARDGFVGILV